MTAKKPKPPHVWVVEYRTFKGKGWQSVKCASYRKLADARESIRYLKIRFPVKHLRARKYVRAEK